jgi:hypothetical protein
LGVLRPERAPDQNEEHYCARFRGAPAAVFGSLRCAGLQRQAEPEG